MACASIFRERLCKMHIAIESYHSSKKSIGVLNGEHTRGPRGGGGPRQGHHFNALLPSHVALASHTLEQMILNIVCH